MLEALDPPFPLRIVSGPRRGRAAACNAALAMAGGEVLIILDDDMQVMPGIRRAPPRPPSARLPALRDRSGADRARRRQPRAAHYIQARFDNHLADLAEPGHSFMPREFYTGNASLQRGGDARGRWLRRVLHRLRQRGRRPLVAAAAVGVKLRYDPDALARQEYDKGLIALAGDTFEKGAHGGPRGARPPERLPRSAPLLPAMKTRDPGWWRARPCSRSHAAGGG